jgi:hypothetical protein
MSSDALEDEAIATLKAFTDATEKAATDVRAVAKWVVGGVAAASGGVIAGASLTAIGALNPGGRLLMAFLSAAIGLGLLGFLMWSAVDVIAPRSYSLGGIAGGNDIRPKRLVAIEANVSSLYLDGATTLAAFVAHGRAADAAARGPAATVDGIKLARTYAQRAKLVRASIIYEHLLLLFASLRWRVFLVTPFIALALGLFAWAANPKFPPPASAACPAPATAAASAH